MRKGLLLLMLLTAALIGWFRAPLLAWYGSAEQTLVLSKAKPLEPNPQSYAVLSSELLRWRKELAARHESARTESERSAVEHDARVILEFLLPEMMRCWLGTAYDFNGTASKPGSGKIACGYFVSTVLMDAGFRVDRYDLAKQPSENILRTFLEKEACRRVIGKTYAEFAVEFSACEPGIYLIGLDTHVAFAIPEGDGAFRLIHASGSPPFCVVDENRDQAMVVQRSEWRMFGNLTADPKVVRRWLLAEKIPVRGA